MAERAARVAAGEVPANRSRGQSRRSSRGGAAAEAAAGGRRAGRRGSVLNMLTGGATAPITRRSSQNEIEPIDVDPADRAATEAAEKEKEEKGGFFSWRKPKVGPDHGSPPGSPPDSEYDEEEQVVEYERKEETREQPSLLSALYRVFER